MPYFKFKGGQDGGRDGDTPSAENVRIYGPRFDSPIKDNGASAGSPPFAVVELSRELPRPSDLAKDNGHLTLCEVAAEAREWTNQRGQPESNFSEVELRYDQLDAANKCEDLQVFMLKRVVVSEWGLDWSSGGQRGVTERLVCRAYNIQKKVGDADVSIQLDPLDR